MKTLSPLYDAYVSKDFFALPLGSNDPTLEFIHN